MSIGGSTKTAETKSDGCALSDTIVCPNICFNGLVKIFKDERALYDLVKCPYCKGKGKVSKQEAIRIDALL